MIVSLAKATDANLQLVDLSKKKPFKENSLGETPIEKECPSLERELNDAEKLTQAIGNPTTRIQRKLAVAFGLVVVGICTLLIFSGGIKNNPAQPLASHIDKSITISVANSEFGAYGCHESIVKKANNAFSLKCTGFDSENSMAALDMIKNGLADLSIVPLSEFGRWKASVSPDAVGMLTVLGNSGGESVVLVTETSALEKKQVLIEQYVKALYGVEWGEDIDLLMNSNLSHESLPKKNEARLLPLSEGLALIEKSEQASWIAAIAGITASVIDTSKGKEITADKNSNLDTSGKRQDFDEVNKLVMAWAQGPLGKIIALLMILYGLGVGLVSQNLPAAIAGLVGGLTIYQMPIILNAILLGA